MIKKDLEGLNFHEEKIILSKIQLNGREIYPLVKLSIINNKSSLAMLTMDPVAWLVLEEITKENETSLEKYLIIFDKELEKEPENLFNYFEEILK